MVATDDGPLPPPRAVVQGRDVLMLLPPDRTHGIDIFDADNFRDFLRDRGEAMWGMNFYDLAAQFSAELSVWRAKVVLLTGSDPVVRYYGPKPWEDKSEK